MNRAAYTLVLRLLAPVVWLWMARRARRAGGAWGILSRERFGHLSAKADSGFERPVWVHAVSLGETRAAQPLVQGILDRGLPVLLTHTTATGRQEGERAFASAINRGQLRQCWLPYDFPGATARFFRAWAPRYGILIEREIWPNLLASAHHANVPVALVSARFSESSLRQARWLGKAMREALGSLVAVLAQSREDMHRLEQAGATGLQVTGNLKFDVALPVDQLARGRALRLSLRREVVVIASTREGEDESFVRGIQAQAEKPGAPLFVLVPRHPQRFESLRHLIEDAGLSYARRSLGDPEPDAAIAVLLGDSMGEMAFYYGMADVAIVAGSFAPLGGQNLIEPCVAAVPVIVGPHTFNFKQATEDAIMAGAATRVVDAEQAIKAALRLLDDEPTRQAMGAAGRAWTSAHAGATARTLQALSAWF